MCRVKCRNEIVIAYALISQYFFHNVFYSKNINLTICVFLNIGIRNIFEHFSLKNLKYFCVVKSHLCHHLVDDWLVI